MRWLLFILGLFGVGLGLVLVKAPLKVRRHALKAGQDDGAQNSPSSLQETPTPERGNKLERVLRRKDRESRLAAEGRKAMAFLPKGTSSNDSAETDQLMFPELEQTGIDEKALRASPLGGVLFGILEVLFPVFKEPNWFDVYDPPLSGKENMDLPYFDGYDFVNSTWTIYVRHRYGAYNWLDRLGLVPQTVYKVFLRGDGKTLWSDGFYGDWFINPAINYFQFERHYGRGAGYVQYARGIRVFQIQRWEFEESIGRYWQRGLRSYLRNESDYWAFEGRIWGMAVKWRPYPRDQGKFIAIRDGANLTEVFGPEGPPWERRFKHMLSLPFYQAHPEHIERIEDNFDSFYSNQLSVDPNKPWWKFWR